MKSSNNSTLIKCPQLPGYDFAEKLGSGSYATVYKAYKKTGHKEPVAVKCIVRSSLNNISKENLLTEIELMKTFRHQHIVELKDFSWDDVYIYLILDYCAGGDLMSYLKSYKVVSERVAKLFLQQLATALEYMRSKLVSHMDLKPSNILLTSTHNPILKVADFGFAHYLNGTTESMFLRGSLLYMAPEIITKGSYDEKADLWSIGVILYECLFGRAPFASRTMRELEMKIISREPIEIPLRISLTSSSSPPSSSTSSSSSSSLPPISESCLDLLDGLLKRNPEERMGYDDFFNHPFIDLIHRPSKYSIQTATKLTSQAVIKEKRKDYKSAFKFYCEALEYYMAAIQYESDEHRKQVLRLKVNEYIGKAEELKKLFELENVASTTTSTYTISPTTTSTYTISPTTTSTNTSTTSTNATSTNATSINTITPPTATTTPPITTTANSTITTTTTLSRSNQSTTLLKHDPYTELLELYGDNERMVQALNVIKSAEAKAISENYESSLERYKVGLGVILKLSQDEPTSHRKELLRSQMSGWMSRAESIKLYLILKETKQRQQATIENNTNISEDSEEIKNYSCLVQ